MHEVLLLVLVLNRVQVDDVEGNLAGHRWFGEGIDVDRHAVGKEQLVDAAGEGRQPPSQLVPRGFGQALLEVGQPVITGDHRPWWQLRGFPFEFLVRLCEALGIQVPKEGVVGFAHHARQRLEVRHVQPDARALDEHLVQVGFDRLALRFFDVVAGQAGEARGYHVPCRDCLFGVQVRRRCVERIDAQRQSLAAQGRPNAHLRAVHQLAHPRRILALGFDGGCVAPKREAGQIALWVDDEGGDARKRRLLDEGLGHHRLPAARAAEHGRMAGQDGGLDVHRLVVVTAASEEHALGLELPTAARFAGRRSGGLFGRFTRVVFHHIVRGCRLFRWCSVAFLLHVIVFSDDLRRQICELGRCLGLRRVGRGRV